MKRNIILFIAFLAVFFCDACKKIQVPKFLMPLIGVSVPQIESYESLKHYLDKNNVPYTHIYCLKDTTTFFEEATKPNGMLKTGGASAYFYTPEGFFVDYRETPKSCNGGVKSFLKDIQANIQQHSADTTRTLQNRLALLVDAQTHQTLDIDSLSPANLYMVITWAKFADKFNKEKSFDWLHEIEKAKQKGFVIEPIMLSLDYMDFWGGKSPY